jgi:hypothetical protein
MPNDKASLSIHGTSTNSQSQPELQFKGFSFGENFGVIGWFYPRFLFTLQRVSPPGGRAYGAYIADFVTASVGRHSTDNGANYSVVLLNGNTPLRAISIGTIHVHCSVETHLIQNRIPDLPVWNDGFPSEFFNLVDGVRLEMDSGQDSC